MQLGDSYELKYAYLTLSFFHQFNHKGLRIHFLPNSMSHLWPVYLIHLPSHAGSQFSQLQSHLQLHRADGARWFTYKFCYWTAELLPNYPPLSPKSYSKTPQVSLGDRRGTLYPQGLCFNLLHTLNFWTRFVCKDSSAITEKSMKSQDREVQFTRKSPWLTVKEIRSWFT